MAQEMHTGFEKAQFAVFFTHKPSSNATWPNIGYDYDSRKKALLEKLQNSCTGIEFLPVKAAVSSGPRIFWQRTRMRISTVTWFIW